MGEHDWDIEDDEPTTDEPLTVPAEVLEALDEVNLPGSWDVNEETGEIMIGIDGSFNGYPLEESVVRQNLEGWLKIAEYYGVEVQPF
jgi:hypothetical protein